MSFIYLGPLLVNFTDLEIIQPATKLNMVITDQMIAFELLKRGETVYIRNDEIQNICLLDSVINEETKVCHTATSKACVYWCHKLEFSSFIGKLSSNIHQYSAMETRRTE